MFGKEKQEQAQIIIPKGMRGGNRWWWLQIIISLVIFALLSLVAIEYQTKRSNEYFELVFQRMDETLAHLGESNAKLALRLEASLKDDSSEPIDQALIDRLQIQTYTNRNEYGFNQGVYPNTPANGTLIGYGKPDPSLDGQKKIFYKLDRAWSYSDTKTQFNNKFFSNYDFQYVYSSSIIQTAERGIQIRHNMVSQNRYRRGLEGVYEQELAERGFFFSYPYQNILKNNKVISVVSPVYKDSHLIGDIGVDLDINKFDQFFFLHPDFQGYVDITLNLRESENSLDIIRFDADKLSFHLATYQYQLPYLGVLEVDYGLMFYISQLNYFWLAMILALFIINYAIYQVVIRHEESRRLYKQLNQDPMTKLYNRRVIDDIDVKVYCNKAKAYMNPYLDLPIGIILIDANKFKLINDTYGHQVGDKAILLIAQALKSSTREKDFCIRMGGDEFLVIVSGADVDLLEQISERIHSYLAEHALPDAPSELRVSVTCAADLILEDECFDGAYTRIDKMLYANKAKAHSKD